MPIETSSRFHGEFSSADASALSEPNSRFTLYGAGSVTAITLAATDFVHVQDISIQLGASGLTVNVYDGADATVDAGEKIFKGLMAANGFANGLNQLKHTCQVGTYPKVKTSGAGQVDVMIRGVISKNALG